MRRVFVLLMAISLLFGLCACGSGEDDGKEKQDVAVNLPDNGKKSPSEEMIMEDIRNELMVKNQYASLLGVETIKSLTNDGSYEITVSITAETKYADWTYEADLSYTKYDQGWMLDDVDWIAEHYQLGRLPDEEMSSQINESLRMSKWSVGAEQSRMEIEEVNLFMDQTLETGFIVVNFTTVKKCAHGEIVDSCIAHWKYNSLLDCWEGVEQDGEITVNMERSPTRITVDPSGDWGTMVISDFSTDGFTAQWDGGKDYFSYVGSNFHGTRNLKYTSSSGIDILIFISNEWMEIAIGDFSDGNYRIDVFAQITEKLPALS